LELAGVDFGEVGEERDGGAALPGDQRGETTEQR